MDIAELVFTRRTMYRASSKIQDWIKGSQVIFS